MSASAPLPDGRDILKRRFGGRRGRFGSPYDARDIASSRAAAADTAWDDYFDGRAPRPDETTIMGAAGLVGEKRGGPEEILGGVIKKGPYEAVSFAEGRGVTTMESADYFTDDDRGAGKYFDPQTYSFTYDPKKGLGGVDATLDPEDLADSDPRKKRLVADVSSVGDWPAPITYSPTSSKNPKRPRTVAAGFDGYRRVLTVVFRDGTFYNYYGVSNFQWGSFVRSRSKGEFINKFLNAKVRGPADLGAVPLDYRELLYRAARTAQSMAYGPGAK